MTPALHQQYNDTFHSMMTTVLTSNVCAYPHPVVVMEFFEVVFRYYRFFEVAPQHIPVALEAFLDTRGIRQEHIGRRGRATYLFSKFVLNLRRLMVDYVDAIIASMQDLLVLQPDPVLASSQPASPVASRRASGAVNPNTLSSALTNSNNPNNPNNPNSDNSATTAEQHAFEDQLFFFETISYLIAIDLHSAKRQQDLLRGFLDPLINQFNEVVDRELYLSDTLEVPTYATFCGQIIQVATSLTKGYSSDNYVRQLNLSDVFLQALEAFCKIFKIPHCQERLRSALRQYIHRMVTCLGDDLIRLIPTLVSSLLSGTQAKDLGDFAQLLGQFAVKYKAKIADFLNESLLTIVSRFFEALEAPIEANDQESRREKQQLKRRYYYLIGAFLGNDLGIVFTSPNNIQLLTPVLSTIIQGATDSSDQDGQKLCFPILTKCIELWAVGPESGGAGNEFNALVYQQIIPACFSAILSPSFGFDAQANILLQHISLTLRSATLKCGQEFINYFSSVYLPTLPFTYEFQQGLLQTLIQSYQITAQEFSRNFKTLIMLLDPKRQR